MSRKFVRTPPQHIAVDAVVAMVTSKMFFNTSEAARFVGTSAFWIEVMCREGRLPYRKAGSQRIILRRDLVVLMMSLPEERGLVRPTGFINPKMMPSPDPLQS